MREWLYLVAADDEKVTLSVINYHVGTDYAAEYYSYLFEASRQTEEGKNVEFSFEEILQTDAFNQKIKLYLQRRFAGYRFQWWKQHYRAGCKIRKVADLTLLPSMQIREWKSLFDETSLDFNTVDGRQDLWYSGF